jgi:hypothetical protein
MCSGGRRRKRRTAMKKVRIDRKDPASVEEPVTELMPPPEPPAQRHTHKITMNVFGRRFELQSHVAVREITNGPAKVIEMPRRPRSNRGTAATVEGLCEVQSHDLKKGGPEEDA